MRNEVPINLSNQQLVQYVTVAAPIKPLSKAVQETELEAWPSSEKPKKSGTCWQRRTDKQKNYIIYGTLLAIMFIGVSLVIICSVILALAIPYRSSATDPWKIVGITLAAIMATGALILLILICCRKPKKFQRVLISKPMTSVKQPLITSMVTPGPMMVRTVVPSAMVQPTIVMNRNYITQTPRIVELPPDTQQVSQIPQVRQSVNRSNGVVPTTTSIYNSNRIPNNRR